MRLPELIYAGCWLSLGMAQAQSFPQEAVPPASDELRSVEAEAGAALGTARPAAPGRAAETQVCGGRIALIGDLFSDGRRLAVIEGGAGLVLAIFTENQWRLLTTWNVVPAWVPAGKRPAELGYFHISPSSDPFHLADLDGDSVPELLVAFNNDGYRIGHAIIKQTKGEPLPRLLEVYSGRGLPQARGGWLLRFKDSGRKAWWGETEYYRWEKGLPVHAATWREDVYDPDKEYWQAARASEARALRIRQQDDGFIITQVADGKSGRDEMPYAKVSFEWSARQQPSAPEESPSDAGQLYLFEKLCGIPAAVFDAEINGRPIAEVLPQIAKLKVNVIGTKEAVRLLTASTAGKSP